MLRVVIVRPSVGGELDAALLACPGFCAVYQRASNAMTSVPRHHVPSLDEPDRLARIAPIGVRAEPHLHEANQRTLVLRDQENQRKRASRFSGKDGPHLVPVLLHGRIGPEPRTQRDDLLEITGVGASHFHAPNLPWDASWQGL